MKLLKFPFLVFDNIIKQLDPIPIISLSFCSKETRERIKRVRFVIKSTWFVNEFDERKMRGYCLAMIFPSKQITSEFLYVSSRAPPEELKNHCEKFSVQIGDFIYDCRYLNKESLFYLGCNYYMKLSIFFNYVLELVRARITDIWINLNKLDDIKEFFSEPCFQHVQNIKLLGENVPARKVTELYDCFEKPVLETRGESGITSLSPTSKLLQSENLLLNPSRFISIEHLLNFTGKYIKLKFSSILEDGMVTFIKHWLDGNYPNLEGAVITTSTRFAFEPEKVLDEFNTKRWNPAERAQNFIFKESFSRNKKDEFPIKDCSNGHDLERNDGLMATILFGGNGSYFNFFVWHNRFP